MIRRFDTAVDNKQKRSETVVKGVILRQCETLYRAQGILRNQTAYIDLRTMVGKQETRKQEIYSHLNNEVVVQATYLT